MGVTFGEMVVWLVVGLLAGSFAGLVVKRKKEGYGRFANLGIGLAGALIGGFLFELMRIDLGLDDISVSLQDILAAFVGSLLFLAVLFYVRRWYGKRKERTQGAPNSE